MKQIPFLLSRRHATFQFQPDGKILMTDQGSTNGTYVTRYGGHLRKMLPNIPWELEDGDLIGFGGEIVDRFQIFELIADSCTPPPLPYAGPETIMARRNSVQNPFIFVFSAHDSPPDMTANDYSGLAELAASGSLRGVALDNDDDDEEEDDQEDEEEDDDIEMMMAIPQPPLQPPRPMSTRSKKIAEQSAADVAHAALMARKHGNVDDTRRRLDQQLAGAVDKVKGSKGGRSSASKKGKKGSGSSPGAKMKEILATHLSCAICQDWLVACHALTCGHMFCGLCLTTWLNRNQTCPHCRLAVAGVPIRCFQVDSAINDMLEQGIKVMSPSTNRDRKQKQQHWDKVQPHVVPGWAASLYARRKAAEEGAARLNASTWGAQGAQGFAQAQIQAQSAAAQFNMRGDDGDE